MTTLVLATHNAHKVVELRRILGTLLEGIELVAYDGPEPVEDGETFAANALIKARAAHRHTGLPVIADDSGICVEALGGAPGVHSARYAGTRDDADNYRLLLKNLGDSENRAADFMCAAAFVNDDVELVEVGVWKGTILQAPAGDGGFGYDPIFQPEGLDVASAQLSADEKNAISHRSRAFTALLPQVREYLI
ncbi:RdgB/HAM1 family non-canonical purine NTP pyrophosphatase [Salinibacterium hongtaonis]|uniref:dITP/XTP pyrophosphatase n=1 Tax=Homoserinimonas hongtaonis TaxID=2079791 RepID=A0A2U1SX01_9MICO|nr:RdgB/HAM1 family non-canonical purine NTP pyrophosphatase [Salinibacterium hongtaonis]AWB88739.1 non-canonical purine NTP pyrophosphatase, RdgB/HAM1 family [Salinibacterium hongtaonis]PWB96150.1 non-canonical purine NTP pyrophosphatase, RdgB/HAM1 family [Salinibacterium hongtaonis]